MDVCAWGCNADVSQSPTFSLYVNDYLQRSGMGEKKVLSCFDGRRGLCKAVLMHVHGRTANCFI